MPTVAAAIFLAALAPGPGAEEDPAKTARFFLDRGDFIQTVQYFEAALTKNPAQEGLCVDCAFAHLKQNKLDNAEAWLKKQAELTPASAGAQALRGVIYYRQGRGADAESVGRDSLGALEKSSAHRNSSRRRESPADPAVEDPNLGLPNFILGLLDKQQGRFAAAVGNSGQAQELGYDPLACHLHILDAEIGRQGWERVMAQAPELWARGGAVSAEARIFQAIVLDKRGFDQEALDCLEQSATLKPFAPWALKNLAICHLNQGRFEEGLPLIKKALRLATQDFQARFLLEQAERAAGWRSTRSSAFR